MANQSTPAKGMVEYIKTYSLNRNVRTLLEKINPLLAKKEGNIRIHLDALRNSYITEEEYQTIVAKMKLGKLCVRLEEVIPYSRVALIFYDEGDNKVYHGAAPNVPHCFFEIFDEINEKNLFGANVGSCGPAIYNRTVFATDIGTSPYWDKFRDHVLSFGIFSAWSVPFYHEEKVIGTFAIYHSQPKRPTKREVELIKTKVKEFEQSIFVLSKDYLKKEA